MKRITKHTRRAGGRPGPVWGLRQLLCSGLRLWLLLWWWPPSTPRGTAGESWQADHPRAFVCLF